MRHFKLYYPVSHHLIQTMVYEYRPQNLATIKIPNKLRIISYLIMCRHLLVRHYKRCNTQ